MRAIDKRVLLAIQSQQPNAYGVNIQDEIGQHSIGAIYAALGRLEERGFVIAKPGEATPERGGRRKLYYFLTDDGRRAIVRDDPYPDGEYDENGRWLGPLEPTTRH